MATISDHPLDFTRKPRPTLLSLPVEILREIFDYLPDFTAQLALCQTCTQFQRVLAHTTSFRRSRYTPVPLHSLPQDGAVAIHTLLKAPLDRGNYITRFACTFKAGVVHSYKYRDHPRWTWSDITPCGFLDEPVISTLSEEPAKQFAYHGAVPPPLLVRQYIRSPPSSPAHFSLEHYYRWERVETDSPYGGYNDGFACTENSNGANLGTVQQELAVTLALTERPYAPQDVWKARVKLTSGTTVRELIEAVVGATVQAMEKWLVHTAAAHEMLFSAVSTPDFSPEWQLRATAIMQPQYDRSWVAQRPQLAKISVPPCP
ncbi:hypothetical protein Dda_9386 [Drechslerella dactyloides]|uniref:F-box domain-containing protein n=1 Tax=Drechslerella dactyloides TaxID=74499 RepID=A0AAD6IT46_DREDA|nr:hypothetical protein Dda_9386 [Drechslerella dactyloides]